MLNGQSYTEVYGLSRPHKLPGVAGGVLGNQGSREDITEYQSVTVSGQCYSSEST